MIPATIPWFPVHSWVYHNVCFLLSTSTRHGCHRTDGSHRGGRVVFCAVSQRWRARLTWGDPTSFFCVLFMFSPTKYQGMVQLPLNILNQCNASAIAWDPIHVQVIVATAPKLVGPSFWNRCREPSRPEGFNRLLLGAFIFNDSLWLPNLCVYIYIHTYIYIYEHTYVIIVWINIFIYYIYIYILYLDLYNVYIHGDTVNDRL